MAETKKVFLFTLQTFHIEQDDYSDDADGRFAYARDVLERFIQALETRAIEGNHFVVVNPLDDEGNRLPQEVVPASQLEQLRKYTDEAESIEDIGDTISGEVWSIATVTEDHVDQWDSNFLKASAMYGGFFRAIGPHPNHEFAQQGYENGEYDTGIEVDPEDEDYTQFSEEQRKLLNPDLYST
jgi:hypothetical protein|tara:strand:+ start:467 stop:1015 length:549 start_codon:yes stop_codon:yes gene_type:complete